MRALIGAGADLNIRDCYGKTALMGAIDNLFSPDTDVPELLKTIKTLIAAGADVSHRIIDLREAP